MLVKIAGASNDFAALARYLIHGKGAPSPDRVAWTVAHNLPTDDPLLAANYMAATAELSPRTRKAAYHAIIAWHANERPSPEVMQEIARKTLDLAGLGDHQALVMGHGDTPHRHLHMLINRVHPGAGKAWKTSHDFARFDRIMATLSEAYGFAFVPAHVFNPALTDDRPKNPNSRATYAAKRGANTTRPQWSRRQARQLSVRLNEDLTPASTWDDLADLLADHDLTLAPKGKGFVVGDAHAYVKLSALNLTRTANGIARRPAQRRKNARSDARAPFAVDGVDIARTLRQWGLAEADAVGRAVADAQATRDAALAAAPVLVRLMATPTKRLAASTALTRPSRARLVRSGRGRTTRRPQPRSRR